jgi:hypothetical protein
MTEPQMKRAAEWFLTFHEIPLEQAHELITRAPTVDPDDIAEDNADVEPKSLYDTGLTSDEGLWLRSEWGGRS